MFKAKLNKLNIKINKVSVCQVDANLTYL